MLERGDVSSTEAIQKLHVVAQAIAEAHENGIVHRDLKPSNILVDRKTGRAWVMDFGLAKSLDADASLTAAGDIMGTPGFMAPEQAFGQSNEISPAADVYGLGAILYLILTGRPPIQSVDGDVARTIELIREHDIVAPRERDYSVSKELNTLCVKSLETDPTRRYQHAGEFAEDLQRFLDGEAIRARPLGLYRRIGQWARHRPGLAVTVFTVGILYLYHLSYLNYLASDITEDGFKWAVKVIVVGAVFNAWFWQYWLARTRGAAWTLYAWTTGAVVLVTCLLITSERGVDSGMVPMYFVLVATSVLRCRPLLVGYVTLLAIVGYVSLCAYTFSTMPEAFDQRNAVPIVLTLLLVGVVQIIALRKSSVSLEAQVDNNLDRNKALQDEGAGK